MKIEIEEIDNGYLLMHDKFSWWERIYCKNKAEVLLKIVNLLPNDGDEE